MRAWAVAATSFAVLLFWLLDARGTGLPAWIDRGVVLAWLASLVYLAGGTVRSLWRGTGRESFGGPDAVRAGRALVLLSAAAVLLHFTGLQHELGELYFADEGKFLAQAQRINDGQVLFAWFIYPHLLFYLDALALWLAGLFQPLTVAWASGLYGVETELETAALVTRSVTALVGASTVPAVFLVARRVAGTAAAIWAGVLIALSPIFLGLARLNLADVPAAVFAAWTLVPVAYLLDRERPKLYLLAGLAAGLAAGGKYPAGTVASAIVGVWLFWRLTHLRRGAGFFGPPGGRAGVVWAGLSALAVFLATTPSFLAFPRAALGEGTAAHALFGAKLYAEHGYPGVVRASNALYYLRELAWSFGAAGLIVGAVGLLGASRESLRRILWLLPFPLVHMVLLLSLNVAVRRNVLPVLPLVAVFLAVGLVGAWRILRRESWSPAACRGVMAAGAVVVLALPTARVTGLLVRDVRPTTRELAGRWVADHLPPGTFFVQEAYTPELGGRGRYPARRPRFAIRLSEEELADPRYDYLFLASQAYDRFLRPGTEDDPELERPRRLYLELMERYEEVAAWEPGRWRDGPTLRLLRLDPPGSPWRAEVAFDAADAVTAADDMGPEDGGIRFTAADQWALFKAYLEPGRYRVQVDGDGSGGLVRVVDRGGEELDTALLGDDGAARVTLSRRAKSFVYLHLPEGSRVRGVRLTSAP